MTKILVAYSSLTDNTKKVAESILGALPAGTEFGKVGEVNPASYALVFIGFWVDKGRPDPATLSFIEKLKNQTTAFFFTLGAYPNSEHADDVAKATEKLLAEGSNRILGHFRCQGKVDPNLLEKMKKMLPPDHPHAQMTDERKARLEEAAKHPDEEDLRKAADFAKDIVSKL
ncbi:MAG: flavodoxin family protein [Deltaproteobacteria bacterium]|nr:flavodoxin family protein [Deltaproteobacteria bacterium]